MTSRRSFLAGMLALSAAPAIVRADSLMRLVVPKREIILPTTWEGLFHIIHERTGVIELSSECKPGFLPLDGRCVDRNLYPLLFKMIGDTFGLTQDNTFVLPDLRGKVLLK